MATIRKFWMRAMLELGLVDRLTTNRADRLLEAHRLAEERGSLHTQAVAGMNVWPVLAERGDLAGAERTCRRNLEISRRFGLRTGQPAEVMLVLHEAMRGRFDSAAAQVERLRGSVFAGGAALYLRAFQGDPERALAAIAASATAISHAPDARAAPARGLYALLFHGLNRSGREAMARAVTARAKPDATLLMLALGRPAGPPFMPQGAAPADITAAYNEWLITDATPVPPDNNGMPKIAQKAEPTFYRLRRR